MNLHPPLRRRDTQIDPTHDTGAALLNQNPFSTPLEDTQAHFRILQTTDLHAHLVPYDYYKDKPVKHLGLTRLASLIRQCRAEAPNALLFDNGDFLQGTPLGDYLAHEGRSEYRVHPFIEAMNTIGYDAAVPGNHEFNYGLDFLKDTVRGAAFPFVSSNVLTKRGTTPTDDNHLFSPYIILEKTVTDQTGADHVIRIGVIGFTPPQIMTWDHRRLNGRIDTRNICEAAGIWVPEMKAEGADIIIALNHSGIGFDDHPDDQEDAGLQLAALPDIDVVICGHQHLLFPSDSFTRREGVDCTKGTLHGKPALMAGFAGTHLGVIDLRLDFSTGTGRIVEHQSRLKSVTPPENADLIVLEEDPEVVAIAADAHERTLRHIQRPVGNTQIALHSYFAFVGHAPCVDLICAAQAWHLRDALARTEYAGLPLLSAAAPLKAGARGGASFYTDVGPGGVTYRDIADLYLYPDTICALRVSGADLKAWLERSASAFIQICPGQKDQPLLHPDFPGYNFDIIHGLRYEIDPALPARFSPDGYEINPGSSRIRQLMWNGSAVQDGQQFIVATNHYRASGGGNFPGVDHHAIVYDSHKSIRDILVGFFKAHPDLSRPQSSTWTFTQHPDTEAVFETGPDAARYFPEMYASNITSEGPGTGGFWRYRVKFD